MKKLVFAAVAAVMAVGCVGEATAEKAAEKKPLKVLMIGNSFSICVLRQAPKIAENLGCDLKLCSMYIGGCSLKRHATNFAASEANASNRQYAVSSNYGFRGNRGIPEMLAMEKWDVVTIQQASHDSAFADTYHPWADQLIAGIRKYAPQAEIRVQQTWSYSKLDGRVWGEDGRGHWKRDGKDLRWNQSDMYENLTANYRALARENGFRIIPMGRAVQLFRERRPVAFTPDWRALGACKTEADLPVNDDPVGNIRFSHPWNDKIKKVDTTQPKKISTDSIHLSPSGEYLQGLVWVGSLFDVDPTACTYRPAFVSEADAKLYRECARDALREHQ